MPTDGLTDQMAIVQRGFRRFLEPSAAGNGAIPEHKSDRLVLRHRRTVCVPTLVLCVGGSARRVGLALRRILSEAPRGDVEILEFDTDRYEAAEASGGWVDRGFVPLTVWRPSVILSVLEGRFPSLSWLHRAQVHSAIFRGAGQKPLVGALAFWINFTEVRDRISAALARLIQLAPPGKVETDAAQVRVVIIASSAGGTGRGVLIPLGLCIRDIIDQRQGSADANIAVEAFVILHSCFQEVLDTAKYERAKANTYALFKELEFLEAHPADWPYRFRESEPIRRLKSPPFDRIVLVDSRTQSGQSVRLSDLYRFLAELLALRIGPRGLGSQKIEEIAVNAASNGIYGKRAVYQAIGGFLARFDRDRTLSYAVPRAFRQRIVEELFLREEVPPDTFVSDKLVPSPASILAALEASVQAAGDPLSPAQLARDTEYTPEFLRVNPPGDLAWEGARVGGSLPERRARFRQALGKAKEELVAAARERAQTAFADACSRVVGGVAACHAQLAKVLQALDVRLSDLLPIDIGREEAEHRVALDRLQEGASSAIFPRARTRARFRQWFSRFKALVAATRSADLQQACREVFEAAVAVLRARLSEMEHLLSYLRTVSRSDGGFATEKDTGTPESAIITSLVPPAADARIYPDLLEKAIDPAGAVRASIGNFSRLLGAASEAEYAGRLEPVALTLRRAFLEELLRHDVFELCARYGNVDLGRYLADALKVSAFISVERAMLGEHTVGEITVVALPPGPVAEQLRSDQNAGLHVLDGDDPHCITVTRCMTQIPLFALANIDSLREAYLDAMRRCGTNPEGYPHIHGSFLDRFRKDESSDEIQPDRQEIATEAKPVEGLDHERPCDPR